VPPPKYETPCGFEVWLWAGAFVLWALLITAGRYGHPIITICIILLYTAVMVPIVLAEKRALRAQSTGYKIRRYFLNSHEQSWATMYGNTLALPWAGAFAAVIWKSMPFGWFFGLEWILVSAAFGVAAAAAYHASQVWIYRKLRFYNEIYSRSKRWQDIAMGFGLFGGMTYLCWPLVWGVLFRHLVSPEVLNVWLMIAGLVAWFGLAICDAFRKPSPAFLHPPGEKWLPPPLRVP
jgi:hypothetical protein